MAKSKFTIEGEDQATDVIDKVAQNVERNIDQITLAGENLSSVAGHIDTLVNKLRGAGDATGGFTQDIVDQSTALRQWGNDLGTVVSGVNDLLNLLQSGAAKGAAAGWLTPLTLGVGAAATVVGAGVAGGLYEEAAKMDQRTRELGQAPASALGKEQARAAWQAEQDRLAAIEQRRQERESIENNAQILSGISADGLLSRLRKGTGAINPDEAEGMMQDAISGSFSRGGNMGYDAQQEYLQKARDAATERTKAAEAAEREKQATEQTRQALSNMDSRARDLRMGLLSRGQMQTNELNDNLWALLTGQIDAGQFGVANAETISRFADPQPGTNRGRPGFSPNNPVEGTLLKRGGADTFDPVVAELKLQTAEQKRASDAIDKQAGALDKLATAFDRLEQKFPEFEQAGA